MTRPTDPWADSEQPLGYARSGDTQTFPVVPPKKSRTRLIVSLGVVVAVLAGAAAYAGASIWYGWSITEPEQALPSDTALVARLDLSPGLGQRIALGRIAQKFPHDGDGRDIADQLKREFLGIDGATYDKEIRPWLGDRIAAADWSTTGDGDGSCSLAALASKDDGTAEESLQRIQRQVGAADFGFVRHNGYALVARCSGRTDSQAAAESARDAANTRSLAGRVEPVHSGELDVEQDHVGPVPADRVEPAAAIGRLGDDFDGRVRVENQPEPGPYQGFVVHQHHPDDRAHDEPPP